jgi:hypothetical protein
MLIDTIVERPSPVGALVRVLVRVSDSRSNLRRADNNLYPRLLGISAFAGFLSFLLAVPASQHLAAAVTRLTKGTLAAKDARMKLVDEMFGAVSSRCILSFDACSKSV